MSIGFPDWQKPALVWDNPFVAARQNLTSGVELFPFFNEPGLKYQSYQLKLTFTNGAQSPTNYALVELRFYDDLAGTQQVWIDQVEVNAGAKVTFITDRLHGAQMSLLPTFPGGTLACDWIFSNRPADKLRVLEYPDAADRIIKQNDVAAIPAATTGSHRFAALFNGSAVIYTNASGQGIWRLYYGSLALELQQITFTAAGQAMRELWLPMRPLHYTIENTGGAPQSYTTSVVARDT